jgi:hypothetical protein
MAIAAGTEAACQQSVQTTSFDFPPVQQIFSELPELSSSLSERGTETLSLEEQEKMFRALSLVFENAENAAEAGNAFDLKELHASLEQADADARRGRRDPESLQSVLEILNQLWVSDSEFLAQAAEVLANGSRERELVLILLFVTGIQADRSLVSWRGPIGKSGILKFFLEVISSKKNVGVKVLYHSLRLVGNTCADMSMSI